MKAIEDRLKAKELELKKLDEAKKEKERKAADEKNVLMVAAARQKEIEEQAKRQLE
jgi:hypothetical protein